MCFVVKRLLPCGCSHRIVDGGASSSLQSRGIWLPTNTFVWLVEILCDDKNNESNDTGKSYMSEENCFRIRVKF
jgi:hypothetical protein